MFQRTWRHQKETLGVVMLRRNTYIQILRTITHNHHINVQQLQTIICLVSESSLEFSLLRYTRRVHNALEATTLRIQARKWFASLVPRCHFTRKDFHLDLVYKMATVRRNRPIADKYSSLPHSDDITSVTLRYLEGGYVQHFQGLLTY